MIKKIQNVLNSDQLSAIHQLLELGHFEDGKLTAGWHAKGVKQNRQWHAKDSLQEELDIALSQALVKQPLFTSLTYPKYMAPFMVSQSGDGGHYGIHVDDALLGAEHISRSDISCTVFLSDPDTYDGGELCIEHQGVELSFKLDAGAAIIYPSTTLHQVKPVTRGVRTVAVSWIESYVRDAAAREILYDLDTSRQQVLGTMGKGETFDRLVKSHANLLRRWADT